MTDTSKNNDELTLALAIKHSTEALVELLRIRVAHDLPEDHVKTLDALISTVATRVCVEFGPKMQTAGSNAVH